MQGRNTLSKLLRLFAEMIDNGECDNIELSDLESVAIALDPLLDIKVDYQTASRITGKSVDNLRVKISRIFIKKYKHSLLFRLRDILKIRDKQS